MKVRAIKWLLMSLILFAGCATQRQITNESKAEREVIKIQTRVEFVPVITKVNIPAISDTRVVKDSTSHLENDFASSDAKILPNGSLYHDLKTKPQTLQKDTTIRVQLTDTSSVKTIEIEKEVEKIIEVEAEKELSVWQRFIMSLGYGLLIALLLWVGRKVSKFII